MGFIKNMSLKSKLVLVMLLAANVPIIISGVLYHSKASSALYEQAINQLISVRDIKRKQIEDKFINTGKQVVDLSSNLMVITATNIFIDKSKTMLDDMMLEPEDIAGYREELKKYYQEKLGGKLAGMQGDVSRWLPKSDFGVLLQYFYLLKNEKGYDAGAQLNAGSDDSVYSSMHEQYHAPLRSFAGRFGFDDILIADMEGRIVYTLKKHAEFGTNIFSGPWKDTHLSRALAGAIKAKDPDTLVYEDFAHYAPMAGAPESFVATPIVDNFGNHLGAVAVAVPVAGIDSIMENRSGLGESGETIVFGADGTLRSLPLGADESALLTQEMGIPVSLKALQGIEGSTETLDAGGKDMLVAYSPLELGDITWGLVAKIDREEALAVTGELLNLLFLVSGGVLLVAIGLAWLVGQSVNRKLGGEPSTIAEVARDIADGDLEAKPQDVSMDGGALGELMRMRTRLTETINAIKTAASRVGAGACEIDRGNNLVVEQTEQQLSSLEDTAANMEQLTTTVKQNADSTKEARSLVEVTRQKADEGAAVLNQAVDAMEEIKGSSEQISAITSVIDEIAFQTNLLALNAAVEAARAGEQGRGFAVVATEVRNLAGRSAEAAKQIKGLIEDSTAKVEGGTELVASSGQMLKGINGSIQQVNEIIDAIALASEEQYQGVQSVNNAIVAIEKRVQTNSGLMKELAESGMAMGLEAENLNQQVGFFRIGNEQEGANIVPTGRFERRSKDRPWGDSGARGVERDRRKA